MNRFLLSAALSFVLGAAAITTVAPAAFAQSREIVQMQQSLALLQGMVREMQRNFDEKMAVMKTLVEQSSSQNARLGADLRALQQAVQDSVGNAGQSVESIGSLVRGLQSSMDDLRARMDQLSQQVTKLEAASQIISSGGGMGMGTGGGFGDGGMGMGAPPEPDVLYNTALRDYTSGNYPLSLQEFTEYLRYYPNTTLASSAQFYIGDIYYQQGQFERAVQEYDKAIEQYPDGSKTSAAHLKKGFALLNMNLRTQGMQELDTLLSKYPDTPEAQLARDRLATLQPGRR